MDPTKAKESLLDLGFDAAAADEIMGRAPKIREQAAASGLRQKAFDLDSAQETITNLESTMRALMEQVGALELAATAKRAVAKAQDDLLPKQETYTLDDVTTAVSKGVSEAIAPLVDSLKQQGERSVHLWERLNTLDTIAKQASQTVVELTGELPRALQRPAGRYVGPPQTTAGADQLQPNVQVSAGDTFAWVDDFVNDMGH
jgi:uncharacterized protein YoxC